MLWTGLGNKNAAGLLFKYYTNGRSVQDQTVSREQDPCCAALCRGWDELPEGKKICRLPEKSAIMISKRIENILNKARA
jgi:hypothetical protein